MKRPPQPVAIEYDKRGQRARKVFIDHFKAKRFYILKDRQGKHPTVRKV
jgi:hypothetical protein